MKNLLLTLTTLVITSTLLFAQAPPAINYQAVARNASGAELANQTVSLRFTFKNNSANGATVYQETHSGVSTNQFGLFTVEVGNGTPVSGTFSAIDWATGAKFLKVEMDPSNGTSFLDMGTTQLLSVPYALYAAQSGSGGGAQSLNDLTDVNTTGVTQNQILQWNGTSWVPATVSGTDSQVLTVTGNTLSISNGNSVTLPSSTGDNWGTQFVITNATLTGTGVSGSPLGLAQQGASSGQALKWNGTSWAPANDVNTDNQTLSVSGNSLSISGGNSVTLPSGGSTYTAGTGISINGSNVISNTGDNDNNPTNEIQTLSVSGNTLTISGSGGNSITLPSGGSSLWTASGNNIYNSNTANVGIGNTAPTYKLDVNSTTGTAIYGKYSGTTTGLRALWGSNQNATSLGQGNIGVYGDYNAAAYGAGVVGIGFLGTSTLPTNEDIGVYGSANTVGVYGLSQNGSSLYGESNYIPVYGLNNTVASNTLTDIFQLGNPAGYFFSSGGQGLYSVSNGNNTLGAVTVSTAAINIGNSLTADYNIGMVAYGLGGSFASGTVSTTGIEAYGEADPTDIPDYVQGINASPLTDGFVGTYAGYFAGDVEVVGNLAKGGGTFKIDHPLDPSNKYLYHSFIESPDMMNIYNGNITTDANGVAVVTLPDYFEALNKDFKYQLTVMGIFAQAIIAEEISNNHFTIKTSEPNVKVSWQVTGVRQDAWANANRVVAEVNKVGKEKGKYLYPELFGLTKQDGIAALHFSTGLKPTGAKKLSLAELTSNKVVKK